jgi:hypothetical protein
MNDIKDEPPIQLPVRYDHSFVMDADDEIVCNLLWTTHRKNWERRDEVCINEHSQLTADLASAHEQIRRLTEGIERANTRADKFHDGLYQIADWAKAYPVKIFPELSSEDWANIADVLKVAGYSLDCVSASNMRHVITKVGEIAASALQEKQP